jgi:hypothetical protein
MLMQNAKEGEIKGIKKGKNEGQAHLIRSIMANRNCSVEEDELEEGEI